MEPGPGAHNPKEIQTDNEKKVEKKQEFMTIKRHKEHIGDNVKRQKETKDRFDAKMTDIIGKFKEGQIPKNPVPLPLDIVTFSQLSILYKDVQLGKASKKKSTVFYY